MTLRPNEKIIFIYSQKLPIERKDEKIQNILLHVGHQAAFNSSLAILSILFDLADTKFNMVENITDLKIKLITHLVKFILQ